MSRASAQALARRRMAQVQLTSRVTIYRQDPDRTEQDETTGREAPVWDAVAVNVPAKLQPKGARRVTVGGVTENRDTPEMDLPATQYDLEDGDVLRLTAGEWAGDLYRVVEAKKADRTNVRTVPVEAITRIPSGLPD